LIFVCALCLAACAAGPLAAETLRFEIQRPDSDHSAPLTGRLFVFMTQGSRAQPMNGPNWFRPEPFFGLEVSDFKPGESRVIDDRADGFPAALSNLAAGQYRVQAVLDADFDHASPAEGVGNLFSQVQELELDGATDQVFTLVLDQTIKDRPFPESDHVREIILKSESLSLFHGRDVHERCAVVLPKNYGDEPARRYPVIYSIPGFGGDHREALRFARQAPEAGEGEVDFIRVYLSAQCKWGHHVYADSATNGPRGRALVEEMIPHLDGLFRTIARPEARFLTGHSSGGWSSLWLQVAYPDTFGGVWSTSPDPVDFRDFQQIDLYADPPLSMYFDPDGNRRPLARFGETPSLWYDDFCRMDDVLYRGGQLRSFEAVFSPRGEDGLPVRLWDRKTGKVDPQVAEAWKKYDISLILEENWATLGPKLEGKLHIITGSLDTFYLEGAVEKMAERLKALGSDAQIEIMPGRDHGTVLAGGTMDRIRREMSETFRRDRGS
jgi:hypothetical protein